MLLCLDNNLQYIQDDKSKKGTLIDELTELLQAINEHLHKDIG